ncbi:cytochrome c556 [Breoghania corrubedonensis]|uniref:Cytochrome c556 n=1 Tax=Breoghania corrubedonensis TaxID=665038 RepID=A0A2T5VCY5_9HYPH|nr:cytochrome c [Breoghania corrubedonensis]PTW61627.1 cytochrome c556 [Breoghania corrubedonensis]
MRIRAAFLLAGLGVVAFAAAAVAQGDPIKQRQETMKAIGGSMKVLGEMAKGEKPYDADAAKAAMTKINESIDGFTALFPKGSETGGDTAASPKIWENMAEFEEDAEALKMVSAELTPVVGEGIDSLRGSLGKLGGACKDCHEDFRLKKE